jgi:hypothetical protein
MLNRRGFINGAGMAMAGAAVAAPAAAQIRERGLPTGADSAKLFLPADDLAPSTLDRLPLEWSKERMKTLQARLAAAGIEGIVLTDQWNIIYFTGLFFTTTERMIHCFIPTKGDHPIWFYPALDRDLIQSWWYEEGEMYFDWLDVADTMPQEGILKKGPTRNLWGWLMENLKKRGFAGKKLAADKELVPSAQKVVVDTLGQPMVSAAADCMYMRQRKTPTEIALTRRAYGYFDRIHAFARDLILTHGTDLTDFDIGHLSEKFGTDLIMADIKRDGKPHNAVGISVGIHCRIGQATGYPHPNQFFYNKNREGVPGRRRGPHRWLRRRTLPPLCDRAGHAAYGKGLEDGARWLPHAARSLAQGHALLGRRLRSPQDADRDRHAEIYLPPPGAWRRYGRPPATLSRTRRPHRAGYRHDVLGGAGHVRSRDRHRRQFLGRLHRPGERSRAPDVAPALVRGVGVHQDLML